VAKPGRADWVIDYAADNGLTALKWCVTVDAPTGQTTVQVTRMGR